MKNVIILVIMLSGCAVGPRFKSPEVVVPENYISTVSSENYGDISCWWRVFGSSQLDSLIGAALENNKNLASAVKNIEIARLNIASARAEALPSISLDGSAAVKYSYQTKIVQSYSAMPSVSWDIDLWGKIRKQVEAAGASFSATEAETAAIVQTLVSDVASTYFTAISYRNLLNIAQSTYASRESSLNLMDSMYYYGAISAVDLEQSRASLATAGATLEQYKRSYDQSILALNLLLGENPHEVHLRMLPQVNIKIKPGLPSSLLERRPDVMKAYFMVKQANAMVGVTIADRLPSLTLTGDAGFITSIVKDVSTARPVGWSAAAGLVAPILNWGTLRRNAKIAKIETEQAVLAYEEAVLTAINDVEQALVAVDTYNKEVVQSEQMVIASNKAQRLTAELYKSGSTSYLDLLDADRTLFSAQQQYVQTLNAQILSYVTLYKALGGGW